MSSARAFGSFGAGFLRLSGMLVHCAAGYPRPVLSCCSWCGPVQYRFGAVAGEGGRRDDERKARHDQRSIPAWLPLLVLASLVLALVGPTLHPDSRDRDELPCSLSTGPAVGHCGRQLRRISRRSLCSSVSPRLADQRSLLAMKLLVLALVSTSGARAWTTRPQQSSSLVVWWSGTWHWALFCPVVSSDHQPLGLVSVRQLTLGDKASCHDVSKGFICQAAALLADELS